MIRNLLSLTTMMALGAGLNAQQIKLGEEPLENPGMTVKAVTPGVAASTIDTLMPATLTGNGCGLTGGIAYYGINRVGANRGTAKDSGYYFGTGKFPQAGVLVTGLAQKYKVGTSAATVTNVLILTGKAKGGTTTTTASIYSINASTQAPATSLGTSNPLAMSAYSQTGYTSFTFASAITVAANSEFAASITVPAFGGTDKDTLAILDTKAGCSSPDSLSWVQFNSAQWLPVTAVFGPASNMDFLIFPVLDIANGINDYVSKGGLSLYAASPNPANSTIQINFSLENTAKVEIEVYTIGGQLIKSFQASDNALTGKNTTQLDVSTLEAGTYIYAVNAGGNKLFSRFVVIK